MSKRSSTARAPKSRYAYLWTTTQLAAAHGWQLLIGLSRLLTPAARGVYHPQPSSRIVLGVALTAGSDVDAIGRELWWRGLGLVERDGRVVAGADITAAVEQRRTRQARAFVTRQLRDAGVRGAVRRWE
jgi:hypothetical protein